jgi:hypothetical protein
MATIFVVLLWLRVRLLMVLRLRVVLGLGVVLRLRTSLRHASVVVVVAEARRALLGDGVVRFRRSGRCHRRTPVVHAG